MYLDKDDHVPDSFDQYHVSATLAQLLVFWEADFKQVGCVPQRLHVCLHPCYGSIALEVFSNFLH